MKLTIEILLEQSQSMNQQEANICGIRFISELRDSRYKSFYTNKYQ